MYPGQEQDPSTSAPTAPPCLVWIRDATSLDVTCVPGLLTESAAYQPTSWQLAHGDSDSNVTDEELKLL